MTPSLRVLAVPCLGALLLAVPRVAHARPALASETDQGAAVEQALGLLLLGDGAHDAYALTRLANADDASLARGLVMVTALRPDSLATHLTHLRTTWLTEVDSLLERPPSPVAEALLVAHASDPRLTARWSTALGHESAFVRAASRR